MANSAGFHFDEDFFGTRNGTRDLFERERGLEIMQNRGFHGLRLRATEEKFHRVGRTVYQFVRAM
jgi:hypothetical protein